MSDFVTEVRFWPSYDHREESPFKGAGGMKLELILRGPLGAISVQILTDWMANPLIEPFDWQRPTPWPRSDRPGSDFHSSMGGLISGGAYSHSLTKDRDYWSGPGKCDILGDPCYGDMGYMASDATVKALVGEGSIGAWREMRGLYDSWLGPEVES